MANQPTSKTSLPAAARPGEGGKPAAAKKVGAGLRAQVEAENAKGQHATDELAKQCEALETQLEELRVKYEMYFLGVERLEPARTRDRLRKEIARIKSAQTRNTGLRFRIESLHARFLSYERMWTRSAREREEGTYRRDLFKARRHRKDAPAAAPAPRGGSEDVDLGDWADSPGERPIGGPTAPIPLTAHAAAPIPLTRPAAPIPLTTPAKATTSAPAASPKKAPPGAAPAAGAAGLGEPQLRALYDAYVSAKRRCNEDTSKLTFDAVARSVQKQVPEIMAKHKARGVEFKVVIKDGKAVLKAVPKA